MKVLNIKDRPILLQEEINKSYEKYSQFSQSAWGIFNGSSIYQQVVAPETYLLKYLINSKPFRTEFNILEIGSGEFRLIKTLAYFIKQQISSEEIAADIRINIVGTRAEQNLSNHLIIEENCHSYELGNFKCENLIDELEKNGLSDLIGKIDFICSRYTIRHFVDKLGFITQLHTVARDEGIIIFDDLFHQDFVIGKEVKRLGSMELSALLTAAFHYIGDEVLIKTPINSTNKVMMIRKHGENLALPFNYYDSNSSELLSYQGDTPYNKNRLLSSEVYPINPNSKLMKYLISDTSNSFIGDKSLLKEITGALLLQIKHDFKKAIEDPSWDLLSRSEEYCREGVESYVYSAHPLLDLTISNARDKEDTEDYQQDLSIHKPVDMFEIAEKYHVEFIEQLQYCLKYQLSTLLECAKGESDSFVYQLGRYQCYEMTDFSDISSLFHHCLPGQTACFTT